MTLEEASKNPESAGTGLQRAAKLGGGTNQTGARAYNERLVLSLIRRNGRLAKAELARMTGLSAQTITLIVKSLEADELVMRTTPTRGRVGQPSVPFSLNPEAVFSFGLKIGRRSAELVLCDFNGVVRGRASRSYPYPTPASVLEFAQRHMAEMLDSLPEHLHRRVVGLGIAMPFEIWNWKDQIAGPADILDQWRNFDIRTEMAAASGLPVITSNDASAACAAEISQADNLQNLDFLYFFIGWFIGGGLVLSGSLFPGRTGNAGALGSMPVTSPDGPVQLIKRASLYLLEEMLIEDGHDPAIIWSPDGNWDAIEDTLGRWLAIAADAIAQAIAAATSVIDFQSIHIDAAVPPGIRERIVAEVNAAFEKQDRQGLVPVSVVAGGVGTDARAIGAAMLPILANFTRDREVLFKDVQLGEG
ncbi:ROK family transcriptional regulator [Pelagibius sp. Alg239-R121]|uniref:ROK family transcriptional regulator n=1 Tax=Pelagibius sp. Alg239-R121 TaxID=2993448 RepID=UPI0024A7759B|nr:ROK family transcriptional regulator [Pelagibius sp. Alg239-R121]